MDLEVLLGPQPVGVVASSGSDASVFRFYEEYKHARRRPVLGQAFEDNLDKVWRATQRLPPFFSNLLPEQGGALRQMIAKQLQVHELRELRLLAYLGEDLPGNVIVKPLTELDEVREADELGSGGEPAQQQLRFSLAGMQLKFSALRSDQKFTMPAKGVGGDWIVKLPDLGYARVPENEFSVMSWARMAGVNTPHFELVGKGLVESAPAQFMRSEEGLCYIVQRFDRRAGGRVHIEDFAQILSVYGDRKYEKYNFETIGSVIASACSSEDFREYVRRLVFMVLSGNADMHLKNWSLIYPDGVQPHLSPAYDLISTVVYPDVDRELALNFSKSKSFQSVSLGHFTRLVERIEARVEAWLRADIESWVVEDVEKIMAAWESVKKMGHLSCDAVKAIVEHQKSLFLLRELS